MFVPLMCLQSDWTANLLYSLCSAEKHVESQYKSQYSTCMRFHRDFVHTACWLLTVLRASHARSFIEKHPHGVFDHLGRAADKWVCAYHIYCESLISDQTKGRQGKTVQAFWGQDLWLMGELGGLSFGTRQWLPIPRGRGGILLTSSHPSDNLESITY